jgi:hypothetical protein
MTTYGQGTDKWFSVYVPESRTGQTITTYESYLRVGSPDTTSESAFLNALQTSYADATAQPAVQAAFGNTPTGGIVFYTEGDLVQFVNGRSDTRVLNDSYIVHVLNKADVSAPPQANATTPAKTYRTYLRLGKPHNDIEKPMSGTVDDAKLKDFLLGLAPTPASPIDDTKKAQELTDALGSVAPGTTPDDAAISTVRTAREKLWSQAQDGDPKAIEVLEALRTSTDPKATVAYDSQSAKDWALASLQGLHLTFANRRRDQALVGNTEARTKLNDAAKGVAPVPANPLARRKLVELAQSVNPVAKAQQNGQTPAATWAAAALAAMPAGQELTARFSLGNGVALYSDNPVTITTPSPLKITVGSDSRSVLGPVYTETYDVSDDVIQQIKDGWITTTGQVANKRLISASLTARSAGGWRTTKFDQTKSLSYSLNDTGSFGISSSYSFGFGLKLSNGISGSFDGSVGVSVSVPSSLKAELGKKRLETSWSGGKIAYSQDQSLSGTSVKLSVDKVEDFVTSPAREKLVTVMRIGMIAINGLILAYTAVAAGLGNTTSHENEESTGVVKDFLVAGEPVYIAVSVLNAVFMAAGLIVSVIQIATKMTVGAANAASPVQPTNIVLNSAGIKLQCGPSYIAIDPSGVSICATQIVAAAPVVNVAPGFFSGNLTAAGIAEAAALAQEGVLVLDLFGELL